MEATREIGLAVLATTLSLVAIFVPVGFMGGMVGRFMKSFGLTMAFAILVSLLVSFTLTPMMSSRWLKADTRGCRRHGARFEAFGDVRSDGSRLCRDARVVDVAPVGDRLVAVAVLLSSVPLFRFVPVTFLTQDDQVRVRRERARATRAQASKPPR